MSIQEAPVTMLYPHPNAKTLAKCHSRRNQLHVPVKFYLPRLQDCCVGFWEDINLYADTIAWMRGCESGPERVHVRWEVWRRFESIIIPRVSDGLHKASSILTLVQFQVKSFSNLKAAEGPWQGWCGFKFEHMHKRVRYWKEVGCQFRGSCCHFTSASEC